MKNLTKKLYLSTAIVAAGAVFSANATAGLFQVTEGVVPGSNANTVTSDEITGLYREVVEFSVGNTFTTSLAMQLTGYSMSGGVVGATQLAPVNTSFSQAYSMYSLFLGAGTYNTVGGVTNFIFTSGDYQLWLDEDSNTTLTSPGLVAGAGTIAYTTTNTADDKMLASGLILNGGGRLTCNIGGQNCGSFGTDLDVGLTAFGETFFTMPANFYDTAKTSGDFKGFTPTPGTVQAVNGQISIVFANKVPEPATLALFGLGLAGMAGVARRKSKKA